MRFYFNSRGQASIEFILVLIFMLVVVSGVIVPLGQRLQFALEDVSRAGNVSAAHSHIEADMAALLSTPSDGLLIRDLYLPKGASLNCKPTEGSIDLTFSLNRSVFRLDGSVPPSCTQNPSGSAIAMFCTLRLAVPADATLECQGSPTDSFTVDTGAAGFTQRFSVGSTYTSGNPGTFVIDFSTG